MPVEVRPLPPAWPLEQLPQDWGQVQLGVHLHCGPQAQAAFAAAVWHPQVQDGPGHALQLQAVGCFVSFMVDFLGGSTTGCHRWTESVRHGVFSTVICDELSARVPDRSHRSTESIGQCLAQADAGSCQLSATGCQWASCPGTVRNGSTLRLARRREDCVQSAGGKDSRIPAPRVLAPDGD